MSFHKAKQRIERRADRAHRVGLRAPGDRDQLFRLIATGRSD
jgi:hypothetical protein